MWWQLAFAFEPGEIDSLGLGSSLKEDGILLPMVVGGRIVERGEYPDAVGIVMNNSFVGCTGTLVAPNVVITAGHCLDGSRVTHVVIGATNWFDENIETVAVEDYWIHPSYNSAYDGRDIGVIKLLGISTFPHRIIANDCVLEEVDDGTPATIVGFGNTETDGSGSTSLKRVAETAIVDADCSEELLNGVLSGCQDSLRPGGEIGAGGRLDLDGDGQSDGARDVCFGDSGGPLYVHTKFGTHVIGVTSRAFIGVDRDFPCRDGSIWVRPDAVMEFLEDRTGQTLQRPECNVPPEVTTEVIEVKAGKTVRHKPEVTDPDSSKYTLEIVEQGVLGTAEIKGKRIVYSASKEVGDDVVVVRFTDDGTDDGRAPASIDVDIQVVVLPKGCGCTSGPLSSLWLAPLLLLWARRR